MGTEVQLKSNLPGYYSMRDLNEDSNSCSWPLYNGEKTIQNGHYYNGFLPRAAADIYPGYGKDIVKRTMLEHEAIFKKQVYELHRLYHTQKDLMDEIRRKEAHKNRVPAETSLASSPLMSQVTCEDGRRWHIPNLPVLNSSNTRPAVEGIDSPMSSVKANCTPPATFSCQNGGNFKPSEAPDSRPSKVRRKMFDLQLPADEYIETDDPEQVDHGKDALENFPNRDCKFGSQNGVNILFRESGKTDTLGHALESGLRAKNKNVADLNKPFEVDETNSTAYIDLESCGFSRGDILVQDGSSKPKSLNLGLPYEDAQTSQHGNTESLFSLHQISDRNGRGLFSNMLEAGDIKGKKSVSQSLHSQLRVSSLPVHGLFNEVHQSMLGQNGERTIRGVEISGSAQCPQSVVSSLEKTSSRLSQKPLPFQMHTRTGSSGSYNGCTQIGDRMFGDKWHDRDVRSNAGSGKEVLTQNGFYHGSSLERKELSSQLPLTRYDHLYSDRNLPSKDFSDHPSAKYYGCSSAIDINSRKVDLNVVHENGSSNSLVFPREDGITDKESKPEDHVGILPWLKPKTASQNEATVKSDLNSTGSNVYQSSPLIGKDEARKDPTQMLSQSLRTVSCSYELDVKKCDISASSSNKKILGFPIFEKPTISKNESCSLDSPSASLPRFSEGEAVETEKKVRLLDINLPCDSVSELGKQTSAGTPVMDKGIDSTTASVRHQIDLNSCVSDDETFAMPSVSTTCTNGKRISGIDLEAPVVPDCEEVIFSEDVVKRESERSLSPTQQKTGPPDELIKVAAQAIVAMSSASHQNYLNKTLCRSFESLEDSLNWFVDIILSCGDSTLSRLEASKSKNRRYEDDSSSEETDYFESMTLKLTETKSDEYLPKPFIPETLNVEESAAVASALSRPRRGQARRGRQRRDFQRDILPGLASLSRHEVTEDLQTFGGLMRATGHVWQSGLTRRNSRNGCARGRRRSTGSPSAGTSAGSGCAPLIQQLNNIEAGVGLEERSLTGWGKTTRRPRRQRCPAGNPPSLALT